MKIILEVSSLISQLSSNSTERKTKPQDSIFDGRKKVFRKKKTFVRFSLLFAAQSFLIKTFSRLEIGYEVKGEIINLKGLTI